MKNFAFIALLVFIPSFTAAQSPDLSRKFGKVTDYELRMTSYEKDTSAHAVYLYENVDVKYVYDTNSGFRLQYYYEVKIKILNAEATNLGDVEIPYYYGSHGRQENITKLSATAYNLENGKTIKSQLDKKYISRENIVGDHHLMKFSIPDVKAGSVIEYRYMLTSDFIANLPTLRVQKEYPVIYSYSRVETPEYFRFNLNSKGYERLDIKRTTQGSSIHIQGETITFTNNVVTCEVNDVPALRRESFVWSMNDFRSAVEFELQSINMPYSITKSYTSTWESVNDALDKSSFSTSLRFNNPYKNEVAAIAASQKSDEEKIRAIHKLVMSRIAWNESYRLFSGNIREAVKTGVGTSAEINFVLHSALKSAGYNVVPILLRPRQYGRLPLTRPSIDEIVTFIVGIHMPDGKMLFLDGTNRNSDINVFSPNLLVDRARIYKVPGEAGWVNLTNLSRNIQSGAISCTIDEDGVLTAVYVKRYIGVPAYEFKGKYAKYQSQDKYLESLESSDMEISDYEMTVEEGAAITEKYNFKIRLPKVGDMIYVKANVIPPLTSNPFNQQERRLPVELDYCYSSTVNAVIKLPEGYVVDEMPEPVSYTVTDKGMDFVFMTQNVGSIVSSRTVLNTNRILYVPDEYEQLYAFMGSVADVCQNVIVLRKAE